MHTIADLIADVTPEGWTARRATDAELIIAERERDERARWFHALRVGPCPTPEWERVG